MEVARIRASQRSDRIHVVVSGRFTTADMKRLEHACCHGLTSNPPHLEIFLSRVMCVDATARAILDWLRARGVRLVAIVPSGGGGLRRERT